MTTHKRRLFILNDSDPWMQKKIDIGSYASRGVWYAQEGDVLLTINEIDKTFLNYVLSVKSIKENSIDVIKMPDGQWGDKMFDGPSLIKNSIFIEKIRKIIYENDIKIGESFWMTAEVAKLFSLLGLTRRDGVPYSQSFINNGYELYNSKYSFRVLCSSLDVNIPYGTCVFDIDSATQATYRIYQETSSSALMCKRAHGGGGGANYLLYSKEWLSHSNPNSSGASKSNIIDFDSFADNQKFWKDNWKWLSNEFRFPVIIEETINRDQTYYAEFTIDESSVSNPHIGELRYSHGGLSHELHPAPNIPDKIYKNIICDSMKIVELYQSIGYRGTLSVDCVVEKETGRLFITEVNARYTGSTHLYSIFPEILNNENMIFCQFEIYSNRKKDTLKEVLQIIDDDLLEGTPLFALTPALGPSDDGPVMAVIGGTSEDEIFESINTISKMV